MKLKKEDNGHVSFFCPGCNHRHYLTVDSSQGRPCWKFNGDFEKPTFTPSYLETSGHYVTGQPQPPDCYLCNRTEEEEKYNHFCGRCHIYVVDGVIDFLNDCTHALAGKKVPMVDEP